MTLEADVVTIERIEERMRQDWRRMHFCRANGWGWYTRYRNRLWAGIALRRTWTSG